MKIIEPMLTIIRKLLPRQPEAEIWRLMHFVIRVPVEDGVLYHHNMTKETLLLTADEDEAVQNGRYSDEIREHFLQNYYLVPEGHDDCQLCDELRDFLRIASGREWDGKLYSFTILTTTDCNARCFYCYEKGCKKESMTRQTALDVADFILRRGNENHVTLQWFGGEPLYNADAIDRICERLRDSGRGYHSSMISNAYLFDEAVAEKAVTLWKLQNIQITLDGEEETYNKTKAYIYQTSESPFQRVIRNIIRLLDAGIAVSVRFNMSRTNGAELRRAADHLLEKTEGKQGLHLYVAILYQLRDTLQNDPALLKEYEEFGRYLRQQNGKHLAVTESCSGDPEKECLHTGRDQISLNQCMADNPRATVILPDGSLKRCEHFGDGPQYGSIYSDEEDEDALDYWKQYMEKDPICLDCPTYPDCLRLIHCSGRWNCGEYDKRTITERRIREIKRKYLLLHRL